MLTTSMPSVAFPSASAWSGAGTTLPVLAATSTTKRLAPSHVSCSTSQRWTHRKPGRAEISHGTSTRKTALDLLAYRGWLKLQALVYGILPSTTAVFSYAIGSRKLSANEQFLVGAQTVVSLLQTTQIKQSVSFIAAIKVYTSTNKTTIV